MPIPKANFTVKDFWGGDVRPENYLHLRDNFNIINHDARRKNKMIHSLIENSVELRNKFKRENGADQYMGLSEISGPRPTPSLSNSPVQVCSPKSPSLKSKNKVARQRHGIGASVQKNKMQHLLINDSSAKDYDDFDELGS